MAWRNPRYTRRRAITSFIVLITTLSILHSFNLLDFTTRKYDTWAWTTCSGASPADADSLCTGASSRAKLAQDVQIVVKTGGTEPQIRLRYLLKTVLSRLPRDNVLVFSDLEEEVGAYHVQDLYADLAMEERAMYPEFALYDAQKVYREQGKDTRELRGGWDLAKYMNLAMTRKLWTLQQQETSTTRKKWFVFIDTDTFVDWDNLLGLLEHLDPTRSQYIGSPVWLPGAEFAHGGSAYALSYGALEVLNAPGSHDLDPANPFYSQYGLNVSAMCCGDEALAVALKKKGVRLKGYWPMFNGELPKTVPFGRDLWCEPVISMHHITGDEMEHFWRWVEDWKVKTMGMHPLLFKDLFTYILPQLTNTSTTADRDTGTLANWDSIPDDVKIYVSKSLPLSLFSSSSASSPPTSVSPSSHTLAHCRAACAADKLCFQYVHDGVRCALSHHIQLGRGREPEPDGKGGEKGRRWVSGWDLKKIREWSEKTTCGSAHWVQSNP